ncbi:glyoxalase [Rubellimicrobium rubrum]|uniref:Glyoxalase n=1 Tax=Rubellimicrobium rubrum TaxID=2585369 RepID=A0A5C4MPM6_9RHOB|nr:VOC family protein [Rubellimicrobium rubrum]TNC47280.1 glyoxalase [Rubellimicrobium rubrum]
MSLIDGYHHVTLSVDGAQEDHDFYTGTLGMKSVKKTVLFDGTLPVYHLYYSNETGDPSTVVTTFPFRKLGVYGRRGTNQSKTIMLSIPKGSADFWVERLSAAGRPANKVDRFTRTRIMTEHPCGIPHELVETSEAEDARRPIVSEGISTQGIKGIYGVGIAVFDKTSMDDFLTVGLKMEGRGDDGGALQFSLPTSGPGGAVEILHEPNQPQGTWTLSGGTIHHLALNTLNEENQLGLKAHLEGLGFTDVSDQKDRNYFKSCYVRSPGGALFELAFSYGEGWAKDEPADALGQALQFPPWFADRKEEIAAGLEKYTW